MAPRNQTQNQNSKPAETTEPAKTDTLPHPIPTPSTQPLDVNPSQPSDDYEATDDEGEEEESPLSEAIELLRYVQDGINAIIGGSGPFDDRINGIYYQSGHGDKFLLSQWNESVTSLIKKVEGDDCGSSN